MEQFVEIDGSILEGGGQILRMAISLSALTGKPVRVSKIRAGRAKPGLAAQHLKGIELVGEMCGARLSGAQLGSTQVQFTPGRLRGGVYRADTGTAGSVSLLLQVALPCALFCDSPVTLHLYGGTNAEMAPQIDFMTEVFRPNLEKFGASFDLELHRRGYFPKGGGHVTVTVQPLPALRAATLTDCGRPTKVIGWSFVAGTLPIKLAHEMCSGAKEELRRSMELADVNIECYKEDPKMAPHNCSGIVLLCETTAGGVTGGSALGRRDLPPRDCGRAAAAEICAAHARAACLDAHTQDQVILYMALARGGSAVRVGEVTLHTQTAIYIAELLTKCKFSIECQGSSNIISCSGIGFNNSSLVQ